MTFGKTLLSSAPAALALGLALPIAAGLLGTLAPALRGHGFAALAAWDGLWCAVKLSIGTGLISTLAALILTLLIIAALANSASFALIRRTLSPLLALPHAAAALGLAFLISPSGWLSRALSPWATGWTDPPNLLILNDPMGLSLTLGLIAKELPFLLLMALAALPQQDAHRNAQVAASLGYGRIMGFTLTTLPALYRALRLPTFAVLAYAMTNVDMAMILGPNLPPPLAVQITKWMADPSLTHIPTAAAAALLQLALVAATLALWLITERLLSPLIPTLAYKGQRGRSLDAVLSPIAQTLGLTLAASLIFGMAGLALWSVAGLWQFPHAVPETLTLTTWTKALPDLARTSATTLTLALIATTAALTLTLASLESHHRHGTKPTTALIFLPLIIPQIAFLPGLQILALHGGAKGGLAITAVTHTLFVIPYVWLSLAPAFTAFDTRLATTAATLGASPSRIFWAIRAPMLLAPILTAFAVGMAVSIGQYLPTLMIGGGRVETLTTEAIALSSGGNRRLIGAYALTQTLLPALGFALALTLPRLIYANRRAMLAERPHI